MRSFGLTITAITFFLILGGHPFAIASDDWETLNSKAMLMLGQGRMLFLGMMEAFHGYAGQLGSMQLPPQLGRLRPHVFAPAAVVGVFLHGVTRPEERGAQ